MKDQIYARGHRKLMHSGFLASSDVKKIPNAIALQDRMFRCGIAHRDDTPPRWRGFLTALPAWTGRWFVVRKAGLEPASLLGASS